MKRIETTEIDAPAYWASFLVNGDDSSLEADDLAEITAWLKDKPFSYGDCINVSDAEWYGRFEFPLQGLLGCTLMTYTFTLGE